MSYQPRVHYRRPPLHDGDGYSASLCGLLGPRADTTEVAEVTCRICTARIVEGRHELAAIRNLRAQAREKAIRRLIARHQGEFDSLRLDAYLDGLRSAVRRAS